MPETHCIVPECKNTGQHILPMDKDRRSDWIQAIRRGKDKYEKWAPTSKYCYVCRSHFTDDDYVTLTYHGTKAERRFLKRTAVPSIFAWKTPKAKDAERRTRYEEIACKRRRLIMSETIEDLNISGCDLDLGLSTEISSDQTAVIDDDIKDEVTENEPKTFLVAQTQTPSCSLYSIENFRNDDKAVHFYTGLENIEKVYFVLQTLGPSVYFLNYVYSHSVSLDIPNQLFIVLMKLRRHTTNFELSRMFCVSEKAIMNIFITWIRFMALQWHEIDIWPSRDLVSFFCPRGFKQSFPSTRVIIDGTECPIRKPKNPKSQQQTFSTYKNRNTVKVLVGATPGGLVSFVSSAYGGSTSDRQITERSLLMRLCDPKDSIMADKGFNVQDLFAPMDVGINIPSFFKKKNRLNVETVLKDRKIANKRVHIERIIGLAKTYKILIEPMSATETKLSSEIIFICFMLCNFRSCIVPKYA